MKFSIIIPAYNCENDITAACESVTSQTFRDFELIIVDDGSRDNTREVIRLLAEKDDRIKPIFQTNGGPAKARNRGLDAASGEYVLFLDCDDTLKSGSLETIYDVSDNCDLIIFGFDQNFLFDDRQMHYVPTDLFDIDTYYSGNLLNPVWNKAFRRDFLESNNIRFEDLRYGEDRIFCADCLKAVNDFNKDIRILPEALYNYNVRKKESLVSSWYPQKFYGCKKAFEVYEELCCNPAVPAYMFIKGLLSCITVMFTESCRLSYTEKIRETSIMLHDNSTRRALSYSPSGGIHIKLIRKILKSAEPKAACILGAAVHSAQDHVLPLFLKFRG